MITTATTTNLSPFYTPSGRYFANAADAAFWTKVEREREEREGEYRRQYEARHAAEREGKVMISLAGQREHAA